MDINEVKQKHLDGKKIISSHDALIVVDVQYDFLPEGSLPVEGGDEIIDDINEIIAHFRGHNGLVVFTQDWHPAEHLSFASSHEGKSPGDLFSSEDGAIGPVLWPDHCVQNTDGAKIHEKIHKDPNDPVIQKGKEQTVDSYSGFLDNDRTSKTGLDEVLNSRDIKRIFVCGLALDYCVYYTAMDGANLGFKVVFLIDQTKHIDLPPGNLSNALESMLDAGVKYITKERLG